MLFSEMLRKQAEEREKKEDLDQELLEKCQVVADKQEAKIAKVLANRTAIEKQEGRNR